jgi:hypothetical protein
VVKLIAELTGILRFKQYVSTFACIDTFTVNGLSFDTDVVVIPLLEFIAGSLSTGYKVKVLEVIVAGTIRLVATGSQSAEHDDNEYQTDKFLHRFILLN